MFKCKSCRREYESEEYFSLSSEDADDDGIFDGEQMRGRCPACGGLVYPVEETVLTRSAA